ncbi:proteasome activator pa28 [Naematelia encephala]|uniref:Proteasome activator pa28 n=1 Tax=Naematelia encephala TaxID=71784 RepID=A0A1Y2BIX2_9TREE|nr:proteasome activator pa28 [Naematelia encephala]
MKQLIALSIKEHEDLHIIVQDLRIWLELEVPIIEDGNHFGADVQAQLAKELVENYKRSNGFQTGCRGHHADRLKYAADWAKYPNLIDFQAAIQISDRSDHVLLRSYLRSLLMAYGGMLNKFQRNWAKVINPKGTGSTDTMY